MSVTTETTIFDIERQVADDLGGGEYAWKCQLSGTVPLPTGAATAAKQDTIIALLQNVLDASNSSTTPLGSGATFTGVSTECYKYSCVDVSVAVDRSGTLTIDYSSDGTNWDHTESYTITVTTPGTPEGFFYQLMTEARYYRLRYVNGGTAQGIFRLQAILCVASGTAEVHTINNAVTGRTDALVTKGVIYGLSSAGGGTYVAVKANPSGTLETNANQATHDNLNANANIQVGDTDVSAGNPVPISAAALPLPTGASTEATLSTLNGKIPANLTVTSTRLLVDGSGVTQPVSGTVTATPTGTYTTKETRSATGTQTSVAGSASNVTLLASNANRLGASFYNDSTSILYLRCQATATTSNFTTKLYPEEYYELPANYTGSVDGIWASATGNCRVTEFT